MAEIDATAPQAVPQLAIFTDFDGTLVEIAETPDAIEVPDTLADQLQRAAEELDSAFAVLTADPETCFGDLWEDEDGLRLRSELFRQRRRCIERPLAIIPGLSLSSRLCCQRPKNLLPACSRRPKPRSLCRPHRFGGPSSRPW